MSFSNKSVVSGGTGLVVSKALKILTTPTIRHLFARSRQGVDANTGEELAIGLNRRMKSLMCRT